MGLNLKALLFGFGLSFAAAAAAHADPVSVLQTYTCPGGEAATALANTGATTCSSVGGGGGSPGGANGALQTNNSGSFGGLNESDNAIVYGTGGAWGALASANSDVLVTSSGGVPGWTKTLPSGLTIPGFQASITFPTLGALMNSPGPGGTSISAYPGTSCTNQFLIGLNASGLASSCGSVGTNFLSANAVTYAKIQNGASNGLLGINNGSAPTEVAVGSGLSLSAGTLSATGGSGGGLYAGTITKPTTSTLPNTLNSSGCTFSSNANGLGIAGCTAGSGDALHTRYTASPGSTPYSFGAQVCIQGPLNATGNSQVGIGWYDGSAKLQTIFISNVVTNGWQMAVNDWTNSTTFNATHAQQTVGVPFPCIWLGIKNDGTNVNYAWSADGVNYYVIFSQALASSWLGSGNYANVGFYMDDTRNLTPGASVTLGSWVQGAW